MKTEPVSELGQRILEVCRYKGLNQSELAKSLDVSSTAIYQVISGRTKYLSMDVIIKFHQLMKINMVWLATGEGDMITSSHVLPSKSADGGAFGGQVVEQMESRIEELKDQVDNLKYIVNLQRQMLEQTSVGVGKLEGAIQRPLRLTGSFEGLMQQYKTAVLGGLPGHSFFLASQKAKLVAPRSFL